VVDRPKKRNITKTPTPMMGGLAIYLSFALSLILFSRSQSLTEVGAILSSAAFLAFVGFFDDRYTLGIRIRLVAMALAATVLIAVGIQIRLFGNAILDYPLTVFWIAAITNAVNFLDNMDGLAAGLSAIAAGFFLVIGISEQLPLVASLSAAVFGSTLGFLAFNFNPASTFMGDMGALPLGFVLATLGIILKFGSQPVSVTWMIPVLVLALPIFDINLVVLTRILEGRSLGQAGKDHTSHRLMSLGLSQRRTLLLLYSGCMFFGIIGTAMSNMPTNSAWLTGTLSIALLGALFLTMMWIRRRFQNPTATD
jgi:UDP-GlcNAc:undecaprenyl-phosphate GlcNAc-1-phosphate transferase